MIIKNVSPLGELDVPLLGSILDAGEELEVSEDHARKLLPQAENYQPVDDEATALADEIFGRTPDESDQDPDADPDKEPDPTPTTTTRKRRSSGS